MKLTQKTVSIRLILILGILIVLNLLIYRVYFRLDFTKDQRYTLNPVTKELLSNLEAPVTIRAFISRDLPPDQARITQDFTDLLNEFESNGGGLVTYETFDPSEEENAPQPGPMGMNQQQQQYPGFVVGVREKDKVSQQIAYRGATILYKGQEDMVPVVNEQMNMEYELVKSIKKLTTAEKPKVGLIQGHGEPGQEQLAEAFQELGVLYEPDTLTLDNPQRWAEFKTLLLIGPKDSLPAEHLTQLDRFLQGGGRLFVGINAVDGDLQQQTGKLVNTGLTEWLQGKGVRVEKAFLTDNQCGAISVQQRQGFFNMVRQVEFRYFPILQNYADHPITQGLGPMLLPFASPLNVVVADSGLQSGVLAYSSELAGKMPAPMRFNLDLELNRQTWTFSESSLPVAAYVSGKLGGEAEARLVVIGDGDFPLNQGQNPVQPPDNLNFLINAVDWLTDDTGLIELRNEVAKVALIDKFTGTDDDGKRQLFKTAVFLLPILVVLIFGVLRYQRRQARRRKWMEADYG
jgi:gliding-associated putative ABC transporter substrate-binding component GldG